MKKIVSLCIVLFYILALAGCNKATTDTNRHLSTNQKLAISSYLASELLTTNTGKHELNTSSRYTGSDINTGLRLLNSTGANNTLLLETQLKEVNFYFNKLKPFIDKGVDSAITIDENISTTHDEYEKEMTYSIDNRNYTIYYSLESDPETEEEGNLDLDKEEFILSGILVLDGIDYVLDGEKGIESGESEMWLETIDDTGNYVYIEIAHEEDEQYFAIETEINGTEQYVELEIEQEEDENEIEIEIIDNERNSSYELNKITQDDQTIYILEYEINDLEGEATIKEIITKDGKVTYQYKIDEQGRVKEIEIKEDEEY